MSSDREYESDSPPKRGGFPVMLAVFVAGTVAGMVVCGGIGTAVVALQMERARAAEQAAYQAERMARSEVEAKEQALKAEMAAKEASEAMRKAADRALLVSRDEFRRSVGGKMEDQVTNTVGKPDATEVRDGLTCWVYVGRTINPETEKPDRKAVVRFRDAKVVDVTFD